jgi:hypothetical protein
MYSFCVYKVLLLKLILHILRHLVNNRGEGVLPEGLFLDTLKILIKIKNTDRLTRESVIKTFLFYFYINVNLTVDNFLRPILQNGYNVAQYIFYDTIIQNKSLYLINTARLKLRGIF